MVIPLDGDHEGALAVLADELIAAAALPVLPDGRHFHVTVVSYAGLSRSAAVEAVEAVAAGSSPFVVHADGYGFFTGDHPSGLSLHVPVVRPAALDALHRRVCAAFHRAGAQIAGGASPTSGHRTSPWSTEGSTPPAWARGPPGWPGAIIRAGTSPSTDCR